MKLIFIIGFLLNLASCTNKNSTPVFDREVELKTFITERKIPFQTSEGIVFIINNKNCNSCILDLISEVLEKFTKNKTPKLFLLLKQDSSLAANRKHRLISANK